MRNSLVLIIITFIMFIISGCSDSIYIKSNVENDCKHNTELITDKVYENKENGNMLVANGDGSFILYINNKEPIIAIGGGWENKKFFSEFEYVKCSESNYTFIRKENKNVQANFVFNDSEWERNMILSSEKLYSEKINTEGNISFQSEYTIVDYGLKNEEILKNSILQYGESALGSTYDSLLVFSDDNIFRYYCSGFGAKTKEEAEDYKKRIKYLDGSWEIKNNQIIFEIDESQIKAGGNIEYDEISMFRLIDYEITHELDDTVTVADFKIHIDDTDPRFESYMEINGEKYYFLSGYKLYHDKDLIDIFVENFNY